MSNWKWCATDDSGKVIKGWCKDNGKWYHLDETNGDLKTGWIQLKSIWYYLEPNSNGYMGSCYINTTATIDGKPYTFDVLCSFAYNCGIDALLNQSTLYKNICNGVRNSDTIMDNFTAWSNGGRHRIEELYRRRVKEVNIFNNADHTGNN